MIPPTRPSETGDPAGPHPLPPTAWEELVAGARWLDAYTIGAAKPDPLASRCFHAVQLSTGNPVIVRALRVYDDGRTRAWRHLVAVRDGSWARPVESYEGADRRIEILSADSGRTAREWSAARRPALAEAEELVRQLATTLHTLHEADVVHLNLRADQVEVREGERTRFILSGLELATALRPGEQMDLQGNPFYAPPESAGLFKQVAGKRLMAWDWWMLGRLVQEVVLGRHILSEILNRDVSRETPELRARAESLLTEQEGTTRAGGLEQMPSIDPRLMRLLRGLLSSNVEGRWGFAEVQRWLAHEPVRDRYELTRYDRLFPHGGRGFTVPEAAEHFSGAEAWEDGVVQLFDVRNLDSLRSFLAQNPVQIKAREKLAGILKLEESTAFKDLPPAVRQELVACIAWAQLSEGLTRARWRGRPIDHGLLREWLAEGVQPEGLARVQGVLSRVFTQAIRTVDADTADFLEKQAHAHESAKGWLSARGRRMDSAAKELGYLRCLLGPDEEREQAWQAMKTRYACSREAAVDGVFQRPSPTPPEKALLAYTAQEPLAFGYVTHEQWREERHQALKQKGERLADVLFWMQMRRALRAGPVVFGPVAIWGGVAVLAAGASLYAQNWLEAAGRGLLAVVMLAALRTCWWLIQRRSLARRLEDGQAWGFFDGAERCRRETAHRLGSEAVGKASDLKAAVAEVNAEIATLKFSTPREGVRLPDHPKVTWVAVALGWAWVVVIIGTTAVVLREKSPHEPLAQTGASASSSPPGEAGRSDAFTGVTRLADQQTQKARVRVEPWEIKPRENPAPEVTPARVEPTVSLPAIEDEETKIVKVAWPFKEGTQALTVRVRGIVEATDQQRAAAESEVEDMKRRYDEKTISAMVAIRVPTASGYGLMLYDGKRAAFTNMSVFEIAFNPLKRTWLEIGGVRAFYLGAR